MRYPALILLIVSITGCSREAELPPVGVCQILREGPEHWVDRPIRLSGWYVNLAVHGHTIGDGHCWEHKIIPRFSTRTSVRFDDQIRGKANEDDARGILRSGGKILPWNFEAIFSGVLHKAPTSRCDFGQCETAYVFEVREIAKATVGEFQIAGIRKEKPPPPPSPEENTNSAR